MKSKKVTVLAERLQPGLSEKERNLLSAAELGDEDLVLKLLNTDGVSAEIVDSPGRSTLDLAIIAENVSLTSYLMTKVSPKLIHQGLLCAIENQRTQLCELLLGHSMYSDAVCRSDVIANGQMTYIGKEQAVNQSKRSERHKMLLQALMKASIKNNFQIVQAIMLKNVFLDIPHDYFCSCKDCVGERHDDYLGFCNRRQDTFRALASPSYIILTEEDPVLACFYLSKKFRKLKQIETEYQQIYEQLEQQCEQFTLDLLNECRSSEEVKSLLSSSEKQNGDVNKERDITSDLPVLLTAMEMEQKQFVAHEKCQAQVSEIWFKGLQAMRYLNRFEFLMLSIPVGMVVLPVLSIVYIVAPWSKVTELLNTPSTRFLNYTCSFLAFLFLAVTAKLQYSDMWVSLACDDTPYAGYILVSLIFAWTLGWIFEEMKQVYDVGLEKYTRSIWNIVDFLMLSFLLASFTLDVIVPFKVAKAFKDNPLYLNLSGEEMNLSELLQCFPSSDVDQVDVCPSVTFTIGVSWTPSWVPDPELISDVLFSVGIILSVSRISFIMPSNETFGTMLVSFYRTFADLLKLFGMFLLILLAFSCGLAALYSAHRCQTSSFQSFKGTLFLLIWSLFGFGPGEAPDINRSAPMSSLTNNPSRNPVTEYAGYILYGVYVFAALVVLMNLLIAVMSVTFEEVQVKRDVEWKFARTELWLTFIEPGCPVAPPFNIIPTPKTFASLVKKLKRCLVCPSKEKKRIKKTKQNEPEKCPLRKAVICLLVRRYILHSEREKVEDGDDATEDKLRRLIELVASKLDERLDFINKRLDDLDAKVMGVTSEANQISSLQRSDMNLTQQLLKSHERYKELLSKNWEDSKDFYEMKTKELNILKEEKLRLQREGRADDAERVERQILEKLTSEFIPKTTVQ